MKRQRLRSMSARWFGESHCRVLGLLALIAAGSLVLPARCCGASSGGEATVDASGVSTVPDCVASAPRGQDEIWLISTRGLGCWNGKSADPPALGIQRYDRNEGWLAADWDMFFDDASPVAHAPTVIHVHGNRADYGDSIEQGWAVYEALTDGRPDFEPLRFVIWSWPSDRVHGPLRDFRGKAARTETDGQYLAWFLSALDEHQPEPRIGLTGYSFGARVVLAALHDWQRDGDGRSGESDEMVATTRVRVALLAAAEHNYWLMPGRRHGLAYDRIDAMLNLYNSCDMALKRYRVVEKCGRPRALGYTGLAGRASFSDGAARVGEWDVCGNNGRAHSIAPYLFTSDLIDEIRRYVLWQPLGGNP